MMICISHRISHRISDHHIATEVASGCASFDELQDLTRVATACGACIGRAREAFTALQQAQPRTRACFAAPRRGSVPAQMPMQLPMQMQTAASV